MRTVAILVAALLLGIALARAAEAPPLMQVHPEPRPLPEIAFKDMEGRSLTLADFRGRIVVLNVWATWCAPCREEMPSLDRLQAAFDPSDVQVIALSMDRKGMAKVQKFFADVGVTRLAPYVDETAGAMFALGLVGLPGTLVIDREGREIGRLLGGATWDSPEALAYVKERAAASHGGGEVRQVTN